MKKTLGFVGVLLGLAAIAQGCTDSFSSDCKESRTCPVTGTGGDGAGEAAGGTAAGTEAQAGESTGGAAVSLGGSESNPGGSAGEGGGPACAVGTTSCEGQAVVQCQSGDWVQVASCPFACSGEGECSGDCVPGKRDCVGTTPRQCSEAGEWEELEACPEACGGEGNCIGQCNPTSKDCLDDTPRVCDQAGEWVEQGACTFVCSGDGECSGECKPGDRKCDGVSPVECDDAGKWIKQPACENVCSGAGVCGGACKPGDRDCSGTKPRSCNGEGKWVEETACKYVCSGEGACGGTCVPGSKVCSGNGTKTCSAAGAYAATKDCPAATPVCGGAGVCGEPISCDGVPATCGANGNDSCCSSNVVTGGTFNRINDVKYPATVASFRLDTYEITVGRFRKFVEAYTGKNMIALASGKNANNANDAGWVQAYRDALPATGDELASANATDNTWSAGNDNRPINWLTWYEAFAFCVWDGGRLPTEAEWNYAAAGGSQQRAYPWLGGTEPGANTVLAVHKCYFNAADGGCTGADIAPVGSAAAGNGRWGQADLAGNLYEWTVDSWADPFAAGACTNCALLNQTGDKVVRGGAYHSTTTNLMTDHRVGVAPHGNIGSYTHGGRCARLQ